MDNPNIVSIFRIKSPYLVILAALFQLGCADIDASEKQKALDSFSCPEGYEKVYAPPILDCLPEKAD